VTGVAVEGRDIIHEVSGGHGGGCQMVHGHSRGEEALGGKRGGEGGREGGREDDVGR